METPAGTKAPMSSPFGPMPIAGDPARNRKSSLTVAAVMVSASVFTRARIEREVAHPIRPVIRTGQNRVVDREVRRAKRRIVDIDILEVERGVP